jgi:phospholipase C
MYCRSRCVPPALVLAIAALTIATVDASVASFKGARPSHAWRDDGKARRLISFPTPIQHVVVIVMENRTVDNLFAGYYGRQFRPGVTWGKAIDLRDPSAQPTLSPWGLEAPFDPDHGHNYGFKTEAAENWNAERFGCRVGFCPTGRTAYAYVSPISEVAQYAQFVKNFGFADRVFASTEGPSFPAHQYLIAGQAGGVASPTAPFAFGENPQGSGLFDGTGDYAEGPDPDILPRGFCGQTTGVVMPLDMRGPYTQNDTQNQTLSPPCEEYATILDEMATRFGPPDYFDWQFIAHTPLSIWASPMAVKHLALAYDGSPQKRTQPFAVDGNAVQFVGNLLSLKPLRPFAYLTYITPCVNQSDHPNFAAAGDGPKFVSYVVDAIGRSKFWPNTTVIVTWDDWGGWYDHARLSPWPYHPSRNAYGNNQSDPNEWGFRVPLIVISPYVAKRGYVSKRTRSLGAILAYVERTFGLSSLKTDDYYENDDLSDMFDFDHAPLPYVPVNVGPYRPPPFC